MTNLEWIVRKGKFSELMKAVYFRDKAILEKDFKVPIDTTEKSFDDCVTEWLQKERVFVEYVRLEDVIILIGTYQDVPESVQQHINEDLLKLDLKELED